MSSRTAASSDGQQRSLNDTKEEFNSGITVDTIKAMSFEYVNEYVNTNINFLRSQEYL